jgi:hypothetical protein
MIRWQLASRQVHPLSPMHHFDASPPGSTLQYAKKPTFDDKDKRLRMDDESKN